MKHLNIKQMHLIIYESNYILQQSTKRMNEEVIDFGNFNKKILINPAVILQILDIYYRNSSRIQATLLGKVYSSSIQILQMVPIGLCEPEEIKKLDFNEHSRALQNIKAVYPNLIVVGVGVTDLQAGNQLPFLHTIYFKPQGILTQPIIVSIGTKISENSQNFNIEAYSLNQSYLFCKNLMNLIAFEKLQVSISLGDADIQSMAPLFESLNDQQKFFPSQDVKQLIPKLVANLQQLKLKCEQPENEQLRVRIRRTIDKLKSEENYNIEQLAYLLDYASLLRTVSSKLALQEQVKA